MAKMTHAERVLRGRLGAYVDQPSSELAHTAAICANGVAGIVLVNSSVPGIGTLVSWNSPRTTIERPVAVLVRVSWG